MTNEIKQLELQKMYPEIFDEGIKYYLIMGDSKKMEDKINQHLPKKENPYLLYFKTKTTLEDKLARFERCIKLIDNAIPRLMETATEHREHFYKVEGAICSGNYEKQLYHRGKESATGYELDIISASVQKILDNNQFKVKILNPDKLAYNPIGTLWMIFLERIGKNFQQL